MTLRSVPFSALLISLTFAFVGTPVVEAKAIGTVIIPDAPYNNQPIPISSFQWSENNSIMPGPSGGLTGKVSFSDFTVEKGIDALSPQIFHDAALGKFFPQVRINLLVRVGVLAIYTLETVALVGTGATFPESIISSDRIAFRVFDKIRVSINDNGAVTAQCWSLKLNAPC